MLPEFHMVLESAENRCAKEVTLPLDIAQGLKLHIEKLEEQLQKAQDAASNPKLPQFNRTEAVRIAAMLKTMHNLTSLEIGMAAAKLAVNKGN